MTDISADQLSALEGNLGLRAPDDEPVFPAPLDLEQSPPGKDALGQEIIDGSVNDDVVSIPGLEDDFLAELQQPIDPDDEETMEALLKDIEETMTVVDNAGAKNERLADITKEVVARGAITRDDIKEAMEAYPGLNAYIPDINMFSESYTLVGMDAGLNALTTGQKALGGGIVAVVLAVIFKIVASVYRVVTSRKNMDAVRYSQAIRTPAELNAKLTKAQKEVAAIMKNDKNPKESADRFVKYMKARHPNFEFHPRQVHNATDNGVMDIILMDSMKDRWKIAHYVISGATVSGASPALLQSILTKAPDQIAKAYESLNDNLDRALKDFNAAKDQKAEDYSSGWDKMDFGYLGSAGKPNTQMAALTTATKMFLVKQDKGPSATSEQFMRSTIDCSGVVKVDTAVTQYTKEILRKKEEYQRLLGAIQNTKDPDLLSSRAAIMKQFSTEYTQLQGAIAAILSLRDVVCKFTESIQNAIQKSLEYYLAVIVKKQGEARNKK